MVQQFLFSTSPSPAIQHSPSPDKPTPITLPVSLHLVRVRIPDFWAQFCSHVKVWTTEKKDSWYLEPGEFAYWDKVIEEGKSYMAGESLNAREYLKKYSSPLSKWQQLAYDYVIQNPRLILHIMTKTHEWRIFLRGEYVEFMLPYQTRGGEKSYVTRTGRTKVQVNDD